MSLYKRKNSSYWWCGFKVNGKRYAFSTKTGNKYRAAQIETALKEKIRLKETYGIVFGETTSPDFETAAKAWLLETEPDVADSSAVRYGRHVDTLVKFFGDAPCHEITVDDIHLFKSIGMKTRAPSTVANELTILKAILRRLVARDELTKSPADAVKPPRLNQISDRVIDDDEMEKYLKVAKQPLKDFTIVMSQTGMRPAELLALRAKDVRDGKIFIRQGKTRGARRTIPMTAEVQKIIEKRMPDLFSKFQYKFIFDRHQQAMDKCGIPKARLYSFRHKFATDLIAKGIPDSIAAKLLGHSNLGTIHKYVHPSQEDIEKAIKTLESE